MIEEVNGKTELTKKNVRNVVDAVVETITKMLKEELQIVKIIRGVSLSVLVLVFGISYVAIAQTKKPARKSVERKISIISVYDNYQVNSNLTTGWGFGCVIRTPTKNILFDTGGNSSILLSNMEKMNIHPKEIDIVVISHIHGGVRGGLNGFLERNGNVKVYIPASFLDPIREKIKSYGAEYQDVKGSMQISDNVYHR